MFGALYERYVVREVFGAVLLVLLAFLALFSFFDLIDELRSVGKADYQFVHALIFVALSLPGLIYELMPIATLIGALYALSNLARHSEITVLRASGLATSRLLFSLLKLACLLAVFTFLVGELLVPVAEKMAQETKAKALNKVIAQVGFRSGLWVKDGDQFVNIRVARPDVPLEGVRIYQFDNQQALSSVLEAERARFEEPDRWVLESVVETRIKEDRAVVDRAETRFWYSAITPKLLSALMVMPERMSLDELLRYTLHLSENKQKTSRYDIALWKKLLYPLATLVMVALALPFSYSHDRVGGVSFKIFSGVMLGIAFYMLNGLFSNLGAINSWPPLASAAAPSALFMLMALVTLWWVERR